MNFLDLFSGIGGFRLGAKWAGLEFKNEFHSDIEEFPNKVYAKHFPNSIQLGDIRNINGHGLKKEYGSDWITTGGFPCQDISIAGKGAGLSGSRSGLWFEMQRIISELQPRYAIMENVPALTFRGLDRVLGSLADIGYDAEWTVISARDIGASHLRKRIWIVAYTNQNGFNANSKPGSLGTSIYQQSTRPIDAHQTRRIDSISSTENNVPNPHEIGWEVWPGNQDGGKESERGRQTIGSKNRSISEMFQAYNGHLQWQRTFEPEFVRVVDGIPNQLDRIGSCGNSIVPQIAELIFRLCELNK